MNSIKLASACLCLLAGIPMLRAGDLDAQYGRWKLTMSTGKQPSLTIEQDGVQLLKGVYMTAWDNNELTLESNKYSNVTKKEENVTDAFGAGRRITYTYTMSGKPTLEQIFSIYPDLSYMTVEGTVADPSGATATRQISPIVVSTSNTLPLETSENRFYNMPFANDNWATFTTTNWSLAQPMTSCEATVIFNVASRKGLLIGSIDHSTWKSSVTATPNSSNKLRRLEAKAGYVSPRTWDNGNFGNNSPIDKHGAVKGVKVASPRFMVGFYDDWRTGLETYGDANAVLCPKMEMPTGDKSLFGWQSWGGQEGQLNFNSTMSVLDFFEKELKTVGFAGADGSCWMVLDAGWGNLSQAQRRQFVDRCKELGYHPGIYHTPFSLWCSSDAEISNDEFATIDGKKYTRKDVVLTANGKPRKISAYSLDPTHPAVKKYNQESMKNFRDEGFEFVKIDFMNNASQEADKWFDPNITTGMQAYNYGMDYLVEAAGDMIIDYSIAPVFPAKAHIRRIGCDAWGDLPQSVYTLNCIEGSWWLDRCYAFNDPDHMCLSKVFTGKGSNDENEARIRYASGLITGMTLLGGTYAYEGDNMNYNGKPVHIVGTDAERARAVKLAGNRDLTEVGRIGRTFRPVEGTFDHYETLFSSNDVSADNEFIYDTPDAFYYVVFNYDRSKSLKKTADFARLGVNPAEFVNVKELFTGTGMKVEGFEVDVPAKDVRIYRFERSSYAAVETVEGDSEGALTLQQEGDKLNVTCEGSIREASLYGVDGTLISFEAPEAEKSGVSLKCLHAGIFIVTVALNSGAKLTRKVTIK